jgi:hypothetical protein
VKILEEFEVLPSSPDGHVRIDLDMQCHACEQIVFERRTNEGSQFGPFHEVWLHELIHAASEHKKVCPNGPMAALDAMRGES